jgi:Cu/Zn superoxide dismutase
MTAGGTGGMTAGGTGGMTAAGTGGMTASGTGGMTAGGTGGMTAGGTGGMTAFMMGTVDDTAAATIESYGTGMVSGTATFTQNDGNVTVMVELADCEDGVHPVHIHQGTSCQDDDTQGGHWDMTRGEGIPSVMCTGGTGTAMLMRADTDTTLAWSVGGDASSDVIGHVFVVHNEDKTRIGCGPIVAQ